MDLWPISLVALAPLLIALRGQSPKLGFYCGWAAGFTMTMTGFYWLLEMLKVFSGFSTPLCVVFMSILCGYQGLRIALFGYLHARLERRGASALTALALAFGTHELVFPLLLPWYFGASVHNAPALMQVADLGGPILVGLCLSGTSFAIAEIVIRYRERRPLYSRAALVGLVVTLTSALYGAVRIPWVDAVAATKENIVVGLVQPNLPLVGRKRSIPIHLQQSQELINKGAQLLVWSEAAIAHQFSTDKLGAEVKRLLTKDLHVPSVLGLFLRDPREPEGHGHAQAFNSAVVTDAQGQVTGRYDKTYLLMFGEYLPFGEWFPILYDWSPNSGRLTPGNQVDPLPVLGHTISALICYEDILPDFVHKAVRRADPDLLVNLTNDAWFGKTTEPWIHFALSKMRSVEHRRYLVRATNTGVSAIVDPVGRVVVASDTFTEEAVIGTAKWMKMPTLYSLWGQWPWWGVAGLTFWLAFIRRAPAAS